MKKIHYSLLSLALVFLVTSSTIQQKESQGSFEKIIWLEIDVKKDSVLFMPYSKAWKEMWNILDADIRVSGSPVMNYSKYKFSFENRKDNLFTILHPMIIDGSLQVYSPYDPAAFGLGTKDDGEMRYPLKGENASETFVTSQPLCDKLGYYLGMFGPIPDIPLTDEYGDPVIKVDSTSGVQMYVYPPRDFRWFEDRDIAKYKLRVRILYNKKGVEKKRIIQSIAPVRYKIDGMTGEKTGEEELFWLSFKEITPILKKAYYFDEAGKPVSYLNYFQQKVLNSPI